MDSADQAFLGLPTNDSSADGSSLRRLHPGRRARSNRHCLAHRCSPGSKLLCSLAEKGGTQTAWLGKTEKLVSLGGSGRRWFKGREPIRKNSQSINLRREHDFSRELGGTTFMSWNCVLRWARHLEWFQRDWRVVPLRQVLSPRESWRPWVLVHTYSGK